MTLKDVAEVSAAIIVAIGGAGAIVTGLSGFLGRLWADRNLERQRHEYETLTRRLQYELDAAANLRKLHTEHEFTNLEELWECIANLAVAFHHLPHLGGSLQPVNKEEQRKQKLRSSETFLTALQGAQQLVNRRALSIPKHIVDAANDLLAKAHEEAWWVQLHPESESTEVNPLIPTFFEERAIRVKVFTDGADNLQRLMREHLSAETRRGPTPA